MALLASVALVACGSTPKRAPAPLPPDDPETIQEEPPPPAPTTLVTAAPPSPTASYEEALEAPEPLYVNDDRAHLTDAELTAPMKGVISGCRVPSNVRVTIKTAVREGRAIGVTVTVRIERPPSRSRRPPSKAQQKADAKLSAKITSCVDKAVREQTWPSSARRDSFTTEF